jgi:uroporphyrinogen-III decarboxylase
LAAHGCFQEQDDWFQVSGVPTPELLGQRELVLDSSRVFEVDHAQGTRRELLLDGQVAKTEEMRQRFEQAHQSSLDRAELARRLARFPERARQARGNLRPVEILAAEKGNESFLYTGGSAPFWALYDLLGFEGMMTALHDAPKLVFEIMEVSLEATLEYAQAFKDAGGHGIRVEECLVSADMISPRMYERFVLPYEQRLFEQLRVMGLKSILYFCGDVIPRLPALVQLPIDALMVEESKKNFVIDIGQVRAAVGPGLCLLGNIDAYGMVEKATEAELAAEVARQIRVAGGDGAFIVGLGSPLTLTTPPERVDLLIDCVRGNVPGDNA